MAYILYHTQPPTPHRCTNRKITRHRKLPNCSSIQNRIKDEATSAAVAIDERRDLDELVRVLSGEHEWVQMIVLEGRSEVAIDLANHTTHLSRNLIRNGGCVNASAGLDNVVYTAMVSVVVTVVTNNLIVSIF